MGPHRIALSAGSRNEAWFWAKIAAAVYMSACLALGAYLIRRRRPRGGAGRLGADPERAPIFDA